jgi:hypothetical protein
MVKGFSKLTKLLDKPFDDGFSDDMATATYPCEKHSGLNSPILNPMRLQL